MGRKGFTLVELLVSIGIIAILIGILLPTLFTVRSRAAATKCRANLHDIGMQFQMYLNESKNHLPWINVMPSIPPPPPPPPSPTVSIVKLLEPYGGNKEIFHCPADRITVASVQAPPGFDTYFDREGTSYEYDSQLNTLYAGHQVQDHPLARLGQLVYVPVMYDFETFHGTAGKGGKNYLFADFHVE